jgi:hypothetical protein
VTGGLSILRGILAQAWPILLGQLASVTYGVIDTMMTGHSSPADLTSGFSGSSARPPALPLGDARLIDSPSGPRPAGQLGSGATAESVTP